MADHLRQQCRDAALALINALTTTGANAFAGRPESRPLQSSELPGLLVYTNTTTAEPLSGQLGSRRFENIVDLVIEGYAAGAGDIDATLDDIEKEARVALEAAPTLGGLAKDLVFVSSEKDSEDDAEQPTWRIRMLWQIVIHTREGVPDAALA